MECFCEYNLNQSFKFRLVLLFFVLDFEGQCSSIGQCWIVTKGLAILSECNELQFEVVIASCCAACVCCNVVRPEVVVAPVVLQEVQAEARPAGRREDTADVAPQRSHEQQSPEGGTYVCSSLRCIVGCQCLLSLFLACEFSDNATSLLGGNLQ